MSYPTQTLQLTDGVNPETAELLGVQVALDNLVVPPILILLFGILFFIRKKLEKRGK